MSTASLHAARFDEVECHDETRTPVGERFEERSRRRIPHLPSQERSGNRRRLHGDELLEDLHVRRSGSAKPNVTDEVVSRVTDAGGGKRTRWAVGRVVSYSFVLEGTPPFP